MPYCICPQCKIINGSQILIWEPVLFDLRIQIWDPEYLFPDTGCRITNGNHQLSTNFLGLTILTFFVNWLVSFSVPLENFYNFVKILAIFDILFFLSLSPGSGMEKIRIRDPGQTCRIRNSVWKYCKYKYHSLKRTITLRIYNFLVRMRMLLK
jgi:hypothetical protein